MSVRILRGRDKDGGETYYLVLCKHETTSLCPVSVKETSKEGVCNYVIIFYYFK